MHPDAEAAIAHCKQGLDQLQDVPLGERSAALGRACADLYAKPACREAMRGTGDVPPPRRTATLARACRDVYCPELPAPKPRLCDLDLETARASELPALWSELSHAALTHDMGAERAERVRAMFSAAVVAQAPPADEPAPAAEGATAATLHVTVGRDDDGSVHLQVERPDGASTDHVLEEADARSVAGAMPSAAELGRDTGVVVSTAPDVPYDLVVTVLDGVHAAGYARVSFGGTAR